VILKLDHIKSNSNNDTRIRTNFLPVPLLAKQTLKYSCRTVVLHTKPTKFK